MKTFWSPDMHWQIQISTRRYDKKGHPKHSANARVNSISKWNEGYCDIICLYFIILFSGLFSKQLEFQGVNQGGGFQVILVSSVAAEHISISNPVLKNESVMLLNTAQDFECYFTTTC